MLQQNGRLVSARTTQNEHLKTPLRGTLVLRLRGWMGMSVRCSDAEDSRHKHAFIEFVQVYSDLLNNH